jgi:hypothetical protein
MCHRDKLVFMLSEFIGSKEFDYFIHLFFFKLEEPFTWFLA